MKPTTPRRTRRLLARAATMNQAAEEFDDYGPEPNMKLSHAFLVVLALHVVAVVGLYAFNSMKAGNRASAKAETKNAPIVQKEMPSKDPSGDQGSSNGGSGDSGKNPPPPESKPAPVAKIAKSTESADVPPKSAQPSKGLLTSARGVLQKLGVAGTATAGSSKLAAQATAVAPAPAQTVQAAQTTQEGGAQTYMVKAGDTMTKIASTLGVTIPDLEKVNGLAGNAVLQVGQILKVPVQVAAQAATTVQSEAGKVVASVTQSPAASGVNAGSTNPTTAAPAESGPTTNYTVVKGDNPWKIAKKFKISQEDLMKANGITDPKKIQIGQVLKIPASTAKTKAAK
jgi:LysM repeat protein